ncbi:MAG: PQQ-binding-like beta-propeller repeat protein, partial [Planctomycetota bacterium]|nr:PQQ-binding-like beta-propeller repeat protein [Planctomycetota bacterium]
MNPKSIVFVALSLLAALARSSFADPPPTAHSVLIVHDADGAQSPRRQFELLRLALEAGEDSSFRTRTSITAEFPNKQLDEFAAVILSDVSRFTDADVSRLEGFVSRGGGLIVFPGSTVDARHYNEQLYRDGCGLLPAKLGRVITKPTRIDLDQHVNAVLSATDAHVEVRQSVELAALNSEDSPYRAGSMCLLSDGRPAVLERNFGSGRCVLFATAVTQDWSDLWKSPVFLPLLQETVWHAIGQRPTSIPNWSGDCRWQFDRSGWARGQFESTLDHFPARATGPVKFDGKPPHALILDGDSKREHRLTVGKTPQQAPLPIRQMSVDAWVKLESAPKWGGIVGCFQDNFAFERGWILGTVDRQFSWGLVSQTTRKMTYLKSRREFELGHWYYVAGVYDGREMRLYVDGEPVGVSSEQSGVIEYPRQGEFTIGAYKDSNDSVSFKGQIARIRVTDHAETNSSIHATFDREKLGFPDSVAERIVESDWPTYQRDNLRSGRSDDAFPADLALAWKYQSPHAPHPAWPEPANQDFWHRRENLKPRVVYDRAPHVVSAGGRVFFGTTADDQVRCLNLETGELIWRFFAEAPVRLAPTIVGDKCLFGADDGYVYCISAETGRLIWKHRISPEDRRIPGNERVISTWPVRTGVLVEDGIAFCCAGIFPTQGVYQAAINVETGKVLDSNQINVSAQGYLERRDGKLFVATGRDPAGKFVKTLTRRGKPLGQEARTIPKEFPYAFISIGDVR